MCDRLVVSVVTGANAYNLSMPLPVLTAGSPVASYTCQWKIVRDDIGECDMEGKRGREEGE